MPFGHTAASTHEKISPIFYPFKNGVRAGPQPHAKIVVSFRAMQKCSCTRIPVWPDLAKFHPFGKKIESLWLYFEGLFCMWPNLAPKLVILCFLQIVIYVNGQIFNKWSTFLVTLTQRHILSLTHSSSLSHTRWTRANTRWEWARRRGLTSQPVYGNVAKSPSVASRYYR